MRLGFAWRALGAVTLTSFVVGCGAKVVFDEDPGTGGSGGNGDGGQGGLSPVVTSSTSSTSSSTVTSTGVGGGGPNLVEEITLSEVIDQDVQYQIGPGTLGVTAIATTPNDAFAEVRVTSVRSPSGSTVVDGILPTNGYEWLWYGAIAAAAPQVGHPEAFPLAQGPWTFHVSATSPAEVSLWKRATVDGNFYGGVLDVNVFLPEGIISEDDVLDILAEAYTDWGGIELGEVRFFPLSDNYLAVDDDNVFQLLEETKIAPTRPALNIMATASIGGSFEGAAGFSLGIPGTPVVHGVNTSAVVWMVLGDDFFDPIILRHEGGHFGGLFHTSEYQAGLMDPLEDTPSCPDVLELYDQCPDYDYIMFPSGGSGASIFSQQESKVLQGGTVYRGVYAPGEPPMTPYGPEISGESEMPSDGLVPSDVVADAKQRAIARHLTRSTRGVATTHAGSWSSQISPSAAAHLAGIGCPSPGGASYFDELGALGALDAGTLAAIATDGAAPAYVRRRAALMIARLPNVPVDIIDDLERIARDHSEPSLARAGALGALGSLDPDRGTFAAIDLETDSDRLVRAIAVRSQ
ncbi:MAG: HEAT repeat domain-containing protein [Polyangiaceae bacterium]|nr:HEAT repeat domain-containing protein [Polyangiaceae bacterium]